MAGYTRQSTFADGDTITSALFNNEYNQLLNAFGNTSGHKHDGTANEGPVIGLIGDAGETTPNNKVLIDTTNNYIEFYVQVSNSPVQQLYIADGAIVPVTDNDIDLGTSSLQFKDLYINGTANIDSLVLASGSTVTAILDEDNLSSNSATSLVTQQSVKAYIDAQVTAQDLDFAGDSGGALSIDLDSESLTIAGGTGLATVGSGNTITVNIDSTVTTLTGSQTLTNKTLTSPDINTPDIDGGTIDGTVIGGSSAAAITGTVITGTSFVIGSANITEAELEILDGATVTTAELNILDGVTASAADINLIDGITNGTVIASKAIITDANKDITGGRNITISGELDAGSLDVSGNVDVDGTLETDALSINGTTVTSTAAELNILDGVTATATELNLIDGVTATTAELNILDGVTATAAEINILDGKAFLDEDNMASNSATGIASQQSIKAYVDTTVAATNEVVEDTTPQLGGDLASNGNDILFAQNDKAIFGTGSDLQIWHDGNNSFIRDSGTGDLQVRASNLLLTDVDGTIMFNGRDNGAVSLYHNGSEKLSTTSTGIDVTGTVTSDGLTVDAATPVLEISSTTAANLATLQFTTGGTVDGKITHQASTGTMTIDSGRNSSWGGEIDFVTDTDKRMSIASNGDISFYEDTGSTAALFWDASAEALGIGTTSPANKLDIKGTVGFEATNSTNKWLAYTYTDNTLRLNYNGAGADEVVIDSSGNVGIGTSSPNRNLHIIGNYTVENSTSPSGSLLFIPNSDANRIYSRVSNASSSSRDLAFLVGSTEAMRIDSSGNVGIGTSSPSESLHVHKSTTPRILLTDATTGTTSGSDGMFLGIAGDQGLNIWNYENTYTRFAVNNSEKMRIDSSGLVGIGKTPSHFRLDVQASATGGNVLRGMHGTAEFQIYQANNSHTFLGTANSADLVFFTGTTEKARIDSSGNLLVGTTDSSLYNNGASGNTGTVIEADGTIQLAKSNNITAYFNRLNSDGNIVQFRKNGVTVGNIGSNASGGSSVLDISSSAIMRMVVGGSTEAMRIDSSGNVGIGTSSPDTKLHVHKGSAGSVTALSDSTLVLENSTHNYLTFLSPVDKEQAIIFGDTSNNNNASVGYNHNTDNLSISSVDDIVFNTSGSTRGRFTDNGLCFNADTAAGNALDDYEEGSFTPSFNIPSGSVTYSHQEGSYTKVGSVVNIVIALGLNGTNTPSGGLSITGLPFNAGHAEKFVAAMVVALARNFNTAFDNLRGYLNNGGSSITLCINNTNTGHATPNANTLQANTQLYVSMTYNTDE